MLPFRLLTNVQVTYEKTGPCAANVTFHIPAADFEGEVQKALKHAGRNVTMKGFRAGKVPMRVLEKSYGADIRKEAMQHFVQKAYGQAVTENELKPIGIERLSMDDLVLDDDGNFGHKFEVSLRPDIELGTYKGLTVDSNIVPATDEEVAAALLDVQRQRARVEPAEDDGLAEDGMAQCKIQWIVEDETVLDRDDLRLSPKEPIPGVDAEAYAKAMLGAKEDDEIELDLTIPDEFEKEELRGKTGVCKMTIVKAFRIELPPLEDLFKLFEVEGEDALNETIRTKIGEAKAEQEDRRIENELINQLVETHPMDLPETMVEQQTDARIKQYEEGLQKQGLAEETITQESENHAATARDGAEKGIRSLFLIQAIAEKEELLVTREEMLAEFDTIAERNKTTRDEVQKYYEENKMVDQMALEVLERKVRAFLRENAKVNTAG